MINVTLLSARETGAHDTIVIDTGENPNVYTLAGQSNAGRPGCVTRPNQNMIGINSKLGE
jgi:hypothetical protein